MGAADGSFPDQTDRPVATLRAFSFADPHRGRHLAAKGADRVWRAPPEPQQSTGHEERPAAMLRAFPGLPDGMDQVAAGKLYSSVRAFRNACSLKRSVRIVIAREAR